MRRALAISAAGSAAVSLAACGSERPAAPGLVALYGQVLSEGRFVVAPGGHLSYCPRTGVRSDPPTSP